MCFVCVENEQRKPEAIKLEILNKEDILSCQVQSQEAHPISWSK